MTHANRRFDSEPNAFLHRSAITLALSVMNIFNLGNAFAQTPPSGASRAGPVIEEITVTAEKREASSQTVPIAITAMTGADLDRAGVQSTYDLQFSVPTLVISTNTTFAQAYIRGVGTDIASIGSDPSVAVNIDGVYVARPSAAFQEFYDVARVEVLKGPQGTLYGRNATGGVINIISELPSNSAEVKADVMAGNYGHIRLRSSVSGPLIEERLSGRLSLLFNDHKGFTKNLFDGKRVDDQHVWGGKSAFALSPSDTVKIMLAADYGSENDSRGDAIKVLSNDAPAAIFGGTVPSDPREVLLDLRPKMDMKNYGASATVQWEMPNVALTSISAYRGSKFNLVLDVDGTQLSFFHHNPDEENSDTYSQELRLESADGGPFEWVVGLYGFREDASAFYNLQLPLAGLTIRPDADNRTDAYAVFGQSTYHFSDQFAVTAGLRYSDEKKRHNLVNFINGAAAGVSNDKATFDAFTPKFGLEYSPNDSTLIYASATRGFKSGGFNSTAIQAPQSFKPEFVWNYEAGLKTTTLDGRLRSNFAAFYYDYSNLQVNKFDGNIVTLTNAAKATIKGLEADVTALPAEGLEISIGLSYLNAKYDRFVTDDPDRPLLGPVNLEGNRLVRSPRFSFNGAIQYSRQIGDIGVFTGRIAYQYRGKYFFTPYNDPSVAESGYGLVNSTIDYSPSEDSPWKAGAYVENIGNKVYYQNMLRSGFLVGTVGFLGAPRTYGVHFSYEY